MSGTFAEQVSAGEADITVSFDDAAKELEMFNSSDTKNLLASETCKTRKVSFCGEADAQLWIQILTALQRNQTVWSLDFLSCPFPEEVWPLLFTLIQKKTGLTSLSFRRCLLADDHPRRDELVDTLVKCIAEHGSSLESVTLSQMELGAVAASIPSVVQKCTKLELLDLESNGLTEEHLKAIDSAMTANSKLVVAVADNLEPPLTSEQRAAFSTLDIVLTGRRQRSEFSYVELMQAIAAEVTRALETSSDDPNLRGPQPACSDQDIKDLEDRLGFGPLPASYTQFLRFSNGWGRVDAEVPALLPAKRVKLYSVDNQRRLDAILAGAGYDEEDDAAAEEEEEEDLSEPDLRAMKRAVQISEMEDSMVLVLVPPAEGKREQEEEWQAWSYAKFNGVSRYTNFRELMVALLRTLKSYSDAPST